MKKRLPLFFGILTAVTPALWIGLLWISGPEQIPEFILAPIERQGKNIGLIIFGSREAVIGIWYPLFLVYCTILGLVMWLVCSFIVRRRFRDA